MYTKRGKVYADPYKLIRINKVVGYQLEGNESECEEFDANADKISIRNNVASWADGRILIGLGPSPTYEKIKSTLVKIRYSNDDQIAIMLNGDKDDLQRMQDWRDWAGDIAKRIMGIIDGLK